MKLVTHLLAGFKNQKLEAKLPTKKQSALALGEEIQVANPATAGSLA